jgi:hypothetical protein
MISKQLLEINMIDEKKVVFARPIQGAPHRYEASAIILRERWEAMGQPQVVTMTLETGNTVYQ